MNMENSLSKKQESQDMDRGTGEIIKKFRDLKTPYKIRKMELLRSLNLPIPKSDFFSVKNLDNLKKKIETRLSQNGGSLIVRMACVPDKLSMPFFYLEDTDAVDDIVDKIEKLIGRDESITHLILQQAVSPNLSKDKISGRIIFEAREFYPREQVLEIFKGARSTGILNNLNTNDRNYRRLEKQAGHFMKMKSEFNANSDINENEMRDLHCLIKKYESGMNLARGVLAESSNKKEDDISMCFEFSYLNGNFVFTDFD